MMKCRYCGWEIRQTDDTGEEWMDRETGMSCPHGPNADKSHAPVVSAQSEDATIVRIVTAIVRDADEVFQRVGGSSRHWVRDCFIPKLNAAGLVIVTAPSALPAPTDETEPRV